MWARANLARAHNKQVTQAQAHISGVPPTSLPASAGEMVNTGVKVVIGLPLERNIRDMAFLGLLQCLRKGWPMFPRLYGRTDINRNEFARQLLDSDYTHLLMLDTDHIHPPDVVERLVRWVIEDPKRLVVGGLHFRRGEPYDPCMFIKDKDGAYHAPVEWPKNSLLKVDSMGHGSILIAREVFERLPGPWWQYTYDKWTPAFNWVFPSEDIYFCDLCMKHGIDLWCDTSQTSPHMIDALVDGEAFQKWLADHPEAIHNVDRLEVERACVPA